MGNFKVRCKGDTKPGNRPVDKRLAIVGPQAPRPVDHLLMTPPIDQKPVFMPVAQQLVIHQIGRHARMAMRGKIGFRGHQNTAAVSKLAHDRGTVAQTANADCKIQPFAHNVGDPILQRQRNRQPRITPGQLSKDRNDMPPPQRDRSADPQRSTRLASPARQIILGGGQRIESLPDIPQQPRARLSRRKGACRAVDQAHPRASLQSLEALADDRKAGAKFACSQGQASRSQDRPECPGAR
jgi:hypothetical protein